MEKNSVVIYHKNCDDGFGAATVAFKALEHQAKYVGMNHGDTIPDLNLKHVYIFDFSFPPEVLFEMAKIATSIHLMDHHIGAKKSWEPLLDENGFYTNFKNIFVKFDMNRSGAGLAWEHFYPNKKMPMLIQHIQDSDLWKFEVVNTKPFIRNLRSFSRNFDTWRILLSYRQNESVYKEFVREGLSQQRLFNNEIDEILSGQRIVEIWIDGIRGVAINSGYTHCSELGNKLATTFDTFAAVYYIDGDEVKCSLRSNGDLDVGLLASRFGGGGHKNSSSFRINRRTFFDNVLM